MNAQAFFELIHSAHRSMRPSKGEKTPHMHMACGALSLEAAYAACSVLAAKQPWARASHRSISCAPDVSGAPL